MTLYQDLAERTARQIADGVLRPGDRLPSVRQLCQAHGVAPITVTQAYALLESRGLIEARPRSGFYVRARLGHTLPEPAMTAPGRRSSALQVSDFIFEILDSVRDPAVVPLGSSFPSPALFPLDRLGRCLAAAARRARPQDTLTDLPPGHPELRRLIALRYLGLGAQVSPDDIIITHGAMEALNLCLQAVTRPGDLIAVESPTFYAGLQAAERLGLKVVEVPSHPRTGVNLSALEQLLARHPVRACLFMLNHANPTGACVPDDSRRTLIELLDRHDVPLIEDDVYAELHHGEQPPLCSKALDRAGRVMHVSSFSKCLAPGFRIGWVAAGRYADAIRRQKLSFSLATPVAQQHALADYLKQGGYDRHLRALRLTLRTWLAALLADIEACFPPDTRLALPAGGYFLWLELPEGCDTLALHRQALAQGISIAPGPMFSAQREFRNFVRLNFGHPDTDARREAVQVLGDLVTKGTHEGSVAR
jgi:DNA-binding transcriptional MocR family regulator